MADFKKLHFRSTALQAIEGTDLTGEQQPANSGLFDACRLSLPF